jgi:4-hydroxybenzoate polyprenyltransferase
MSRNAINVKEFVLATTAALVLGVLLSIGAVYGLNRIFDLYDPPRILSAD